jgi:eukaryotic-like serine/threonine-protein kinase
LAVFGGRAAKTPAGPTLSHTLRADLVKMIPNFRAPRPDADVLSASIARDIVKRAPARSVPSLTPPPRRISQTFARVNPARTGAELPTGSLPPIPEPPLPAPFRTPSVLQEGKILHDQYLVERIVGSAGTCVLVKVRHARLGRRLRLKYLAPEASTKPQAAEHFLHAARAAMRLRSEHTARTLDVGYLPSGLPFVVTEAFQGTELRELLRARGALADEEAVDFILQAAQAVAEAHRQSLAHGSLSPSTLFVTAGPDGVPLVKVLEFGCSATLREDPLAARLRRWTHGTAVLWESTQLWDTLAYSAPEQLRRSEAPTPAADIWALGATLYEMLTGAPPFSAPSTTALMAAVVADEPVPPRSIASDLPRKLEAVVLRCLAKAPEARFPTVTDFAAELREFASPEARLSVDRIARIEAHDPQQSTWLGTGRAPSQLPPREPSQPTGAPPPRARARLRPPDPRALLSSDVPWRPILLALIGAAMGALGGTLAARGVTSLTGGGSSTVSPASSASSR